MYKRNDKQEGQGSIVGDAQTIHARKREERQHIPTVAYSPGKEQDKQQ